MEPIFWLDQDYFWDLEKGGVFKNGAEVPIEEIPKDIVRELKLAGLVLPKGLDKIIISPTDIYFKEKEIVAKINEDYKSIKEPLVVVGILKGSFIFMADLVRQLKIPHVVDFMAVSSYGDKTENDGNVRIIMDCRVNQKGRDVLIVEDIVDSGYTLSYLVNNFKARGVNSVSTVTLLDKSVGRKVNFDVDYAGFKLEGDDWVVGYGLDAGEKWRTLPYIATIKRN